MANSKRFIKLLRILKITLLLLKLENIYPLLKKSVSNLKQEQKISIRNKGFIMFKVLVKT